MMHPLVRMMLEERIAADAETLSIKHLDFDPELACAVRIERFRTEGECPNPARWVMRCRVCSITAGACDEHKQTIRNLVVSNCGRCGAIGPGIVLWEFLPLGRES